MKRFAVAGAAFLLAGLSLAHPEFGSAQTSTPWPTFHGNAQRTGASAVNGPTSGSEQNQWNIAGAAFESSIAVDATGVAYVGADDGNVYAFDPTVPTHPKWTFTTGGPVTAAPTVSNDGKTVYVASNDGSVYALNAVTGAKIWSTSVDGAVRTSPALSPDGSALYVANLYGSLRILGASDGAERARVYLGATPHGSLALSSDGGTLYAAVQLAEVLAIPVTPTSFGSTFTFYQLGGQPSTSPAVDANGTVYIGTTSGTLEAYSPGSSSPRWVFSIPDHVAPLNTPAVGNGLVVFGTQSGTVYAANAGTGVLAFQSHFSGAVEDAAAIATGNSMVYVAADDGTVSGFDATGKSVWSRKIGGFFASSPALGPDGSLWVANMAGEIVRINNLSAPGGPPPTATPGPSNTPTATPTAGPSATPTATATPPAPAATVQLKGTVKPGSKQVIKVASRPNTIIRFRVDYPNGDHQSHSGTTNAQGTVSYSYKQGGSKITLRSSTATVTVKVGDSPNQSVTTQTYKIGYGTIDVSAEPRTQSVNKRVDFYVHAATGSRVAIYLTFPNGRVIGRVGTTGRKGWSHLVYVVQAGMTKGSNHKVKVLARFYRGTPRTTAQTFFTIK